MKGNFAFIMAVEDRQVLVHKDKSEDGEPVVSFSFKAGIGRIDSSVVFDNTEEGYESRDRIFDQMLAEHEGREEPHNLPNVRKQVQDMVEAFGEPED